MKREKNITDGQLVLRKDSIYLVVGNKDNVKQMIKIKDVKVQEITDEVVIIENEQKELNALIKAVNALVKLDITWLSTIPVTKDVIGLKIKLKENTIKKFVNGNFLLDFEIKEQKKKENELILQPVKELNIRELYLYRGIKTARLYMYLGSGYLHIIDSSLNEPNAILSMLDNAQKEVNEHDMYINSGFTRSGRLRKINKKLENSLYLTHLRYKMVYVSKVETNNLLKAGFSLESIKGLIG